MESTERVALATPDAHEDAGTTSGAATGGDHGVLRRRLGGPVGGHASRRGIWFDPAPWAVVVATLTWLLCVVHQYPCRQRVYGNTVDALKRLCYSDIPIQYQSSGLATGQRPYLDFALDHATVTAAFMVVARTISRLFGFPSRDGVTPQQELDGSYAFLLATAVLLFVCYLAMVAAHLLIGRGSSRNQVPGKRLGVRQRVRSWDAMFVAFAPVVAAAGLVNWDLLAAALVSMGLLAWACRRPMAAGVLLGLGISTKFYPAVVVLALVLLCLRAGRARESARLVIGVLVAWLVANLPVVLLAPTRWAQWYAGWFGNQSDLGSIWYLLALWHVQVPRPGIVGALLWIAAAAYVAQLSLGAPRRPRVGQVAFLLVAALVLTERGYPPQHALWLVPLLALARPTWTDWAAYSVAELLYFWAVWGHLDNLTVVGDGPDVWYWLACLLRMGVLVWLCVRVIDDIRHPWGDPVRTPFTDDPAGGVLDHAPDAGPETDDDILGEFDDDEVVSDEVGSDEDAAPAGAASDAEREE